MLSERELQQPQFVRVPNVVGLPLRKALLRVQQSGLRLGATLFRESYEEKDMVLEQRPIRGQMVKGNEEVTLWVSRESYIKWLPAIYQRSDTTGRNVVRDLLWLIQHLFGSIEAQLDGMHLYFDSYETREDFLPWLAGWSAMVLEPDWPMSKKRRLIKKAMELYRWRGTVKGLKLFISLFTGFEPHLAENEWPYQGLRIGVSSSVGIDTVILPPVEKSNAFMVVMPHQFKDISPESIIRLHEIIEMEKPAHTHYMLKFEEPRSDVEERAFYRIGVSSGINIGEEIVTPLPMNPETGQAELPKEPEMPPPQANPSVYELFGSKRRALPPILGAPKADGAAVEGNEVKTSKAFFEGAREFKLDDIMRELLERAGVPLENVQITATDASAEGVATEGGSSTGVGAGAGTGTGTESGTNASDENPGGGENQGSVATGVISGAPKTSTTAAMAALGSAWSDLAGEAGEGSSLRSVGASKPEDGTSAAGDTDDAKGVVGVESLQGMRKRGQQRVEVEVDAQVVDIDEVDVLDEAGESKPTQSAGSGPGTASASPTLNQQETVKLQGPVVAAEKPVKAETPRAPMGDGVDTVLLGGSEIISQIQGERQGQRGPRVEVEVETKVVDREVVESAQADKGDPSKK